MKTFIFSLFLGKSLACSRYLHWMAGDLENKEDFIELLTSLDLTSLDFQEFMDGSGSGGGETEVSEVTGDSGLEPEIPVDLLNDLIFGVSLPFKAEDKGDVVKDKEWFENDDVAHMERNVSREFCAGECWAYDWEKNECYIPEDSTDISVSCGGM